MSKKIKTFKSLVQSSKFKFTGLTVTLEDATKKDTINASKKKKIDPYESFFIAISDKNWEQAEKIFSDNPHINFNRKIYFKNEYETRNLLLDNDFKNSSYEKLDSMSIFSYLIINSQTKLLNKFLEKYPRNYKQVYTKESDDYPFYMLTALLIQDDIESFKKLLPSYNDSTTKTKMFERIDQEIDYIKDTIYEEKNKEIFYPQKIITYVLDEYMNKQKNISTHSGSLIKSIIINQDENNFLKILEKHKKLDDLLDEFTGRDSPKKNLEVFKFVAHCYYKKYNKALSVDGLPLLLYAMRENENLWNNLNNVINYFKNFSEFREDVLDFLKKDNMKQIVLNNQESFKNIKEWGVDWTNYHKNEYNLLGAFIKQKLNSLKIYSKSKNQEKDRIIKELVEGCLYALKEAPQLYEKKFYGKLPIQMLKGEKNHSLTKVISAIENIILQKAVQDKPVTYKVIKNKLL